MPLVNMRDMLLHAYRNGYAVGSFDLLSIDCLSAIVAAAERSRSPVILSIAETDFAGGDVELLAAAVERAAQRAAVPVAIAFDRGRSIDSAVNAIRYGCNGVMVDAAHCDFPDNVAQTRRVVDMAHGCGVAVEGELGCNSGDESDATIGSTQPTAGTSVKEAEAYVARTGIDFLAVTVGGLHGRARAKSKIDFERLKRINEALRIPLVLRGHCSVSGDQARRLIANGIAKISCSIARSDSAGVATRDGLRGEAERCMVSWGSAGRAAEVIAQCEPWQSVQHVVVYNAANSADVASMMAHGRDILATVPGVRRVIAGYAVQEAVKYQFCWVIEFSHRNVIESYRDHPVHREFADNVFRPIAADRMTIDFVTVTDSDRAARAPRANVMPSIGAVQKKKADTMGWREVPA